MIVTERDGGDDHGSDDGDVEGEDDEDGDDEWRFDKDNDVSPRERDECLSTPT